MGWEMFFKDACKPFVVSGWMVGILTGFWIFIVILLIVVLFLFVPTLIGAPWVPTRMDNVRMMLSMAEVKNGDIVYDLGSGDGRIIITAAKEFHARSVGVEANPLWIIWTRWRTRILKLRGHVEVVWGNFFRKDLSEADVVTLYLLQGTNNKLKQKLEKELKPGARVVSHYFTFQGWRPLNADFKAQIYLYEIGNHKYST
jgi:precorrin-6B methylase 2